MTSAKVMKIEMTRIAILFIILLSSSAICPAQIVINSKFQPLSYEELYMQAMIEVEHKQRQKEKFEYYQTKAYKCYDRQDWYGFLTYSNYALDTGLSNARLYYYRGVVYEWLNDFKQAKKNYKKTKKKGYAYAEPALASLKEKEKAYKQAQKSKPRQ